MWVLLLVTFLGVLIGVQEYRIRAIRNAAKSRTIEYHDITDQVLAALDEARAEESAEGRGPNCRVGAPEGP